MKHSRLLKSNYEFNKALDIAGVFGDVGTSADSARSLIMNTIEYYPELITPEKLNQTILEIEQSLNKLKGLL